MSELVSQILDTATVAPTPEATPTDTQTAATAEQKPNETNQEFAKRLEHLAKQERKFQEEKRNFKLEQENLMKKLNEEKGKLQKYETLEQRLSQKDFSALEELGFNFDEYTRTVLNNNELPADILIKKELDSLRSEMKQLLAQKDEEIQKKQAEALANHQKALESQWVLEIKETLAKGENADKFSFLSSRPDGAEVVLSLIQQSWDNKKQKLTVEDAAEMANKYFFEEEKKRISTHKDKLSGVFLESLGIEQNEFDTWLKSRKALSDKGVAQKAKDVSGMTTLTNNNTSLSASEPKKKLSREESLLLATKLLKS